MKFLILILMAFFAGVPEAAYSQMKPESPAPELLKEAEGREPMPLRQFEQFALSSNPTLQQSDAVMRQSAGMARQAGLFPNPTVGYQGEQIRGGAYGGGEQGAFVQQTFVLGGKLGLRRNVFEQQRKEDEIAVDEQRTGILGDMRRQFYAALAAQEMVNLRRRLVGVATDATKTANQLANVGQADAPDVLQAEVEAEQAKIDYMNAQRMFRQEFRSLAAAAGRPDLPLAPLAGDLTKPPQIDTSRMVDQMMQESPAVNRARQDIVRADAALKSAKRESVPDLQVHAGLQNNFQPLGEATGLPVGVQAFITAGIALPIFNRNQGNVAAATAASEQARLEVTRVQLSLRRSAEPAVEEYLAAQAEAQRYKDEMIPRAARAYQLYLTKYRQMGAAYPQVIVSQRTLFQLQAAYVGVLEDLWANAIALQNFMLTNGLNGPGSSGAMSTGINLPSSSGGN